MMSEWRPLGYRDHHQRGDLYWCECSGRCSEGATCDCCELVELRAEVERLTAELADRDQRIEAALALMWHPTEVTGCNCLAHQIAAILRGES